MRPQRHPSTTTAAFRLVRAIPDSVTGLHIMHAMAYTTGRTLPRGVRRETRWVSRSDGGTVRVEVFRPDFDAGPLPVVLHLHGGGYAIGAPRQDVPLFAQIMATRPCIIVAPRYRRSLQAPFPAALEDCHDVLVWLHGHAYELGARKTQVIVMGQSAGGGLAAALCLLARDRGSASVSAQFLVGAMLDDRTRITDLDPADLSWSLGKNQLAWQLYLKGQRATELSSPSRAESLAGLPPAFGICGDCDLFHAENVDYFGRLAATGGVAEFQTVAGGYHGVQVFAPKSEPGEAFSELLSETFVRALDTCSRQGARRTGP